LKEMPRLFERDFVVGFFLPSVIFLILNLALVTGFGLSPPVDPEWIAGHIWTVAAAVLTSWIFGIILLSLNRTIYRIVEGYHDPLRAMSILKRLQIRRHEKIASSIETLKTDIERTGGGAERDRKIKELIRLRFELSEAFPSQKQFILPTSLGNVIRSFESYPEQMYGIDPIAGWNRLLAVIPKEYQQLVDAEKSMTDLWVNLCFLSLISLIEYVCFLGWHIWSSAGDAALVAAVAGAAPPMVWFPIAALGLAALAYGQAKSVAAEWGDMVKAAFDVFLPALGNKMAFAPPSDREQERHLWGSFSDAVLYRRPDLMPARTQALPTVAASAGSESPAASGGDTKALEPPSEAPPQPGDDQPPISDDTDGQ
jgi:hypothetical protein